MTRLVGQTGGHSNKQPRRIMAKIEDMPLQQDQPKHHNLRNVGVDVGVDADENVDVAVVAARGC